MDYNTSLKTLSRTEYLMKITQDLKESLKEEGLLDEESYSALNRISHILLGANRVTRVILNRSQVGVKSDG